MKMTSQGKGGVYQSLDVTNAGGDYNAPASRHPYDTKGSFFKSMKQPAPPEEPRRSSLSLFSTPGKKSFLNPIGFGKKNSTPSINAPFDFAAINNLSKDLDLILKTSMIDIQ